MIRPLIALAVLAVLVASMPSLAHAKMIKGHVSTKRDFMYMGKFCVGGNSAHMTFAASHISPEEDVEDGDFKLSFYNDQSSEPYYWPDIYKSDLSCSEKVDRAERSHAIKDESLPVTFNEPRHPRYWYIAVNDCDLPDDEKMKIHVQIHWQYDTQNSWYREFSYEDQELLIMYMMFSIFWGIGIFVVAIGSFMLWMKGQYSFVIKLFDSSVVLTVMSLFSYLIHYSVYTDNGHGVPSLLIFGDALDMLSYLTFACCLLLVAKGVALERIDLRELKFDFMIVGALSFVYIIFWVWQVCFPYILPQSNDYKWNCTPGIIMLCIQGLIWLYFVALSVVSFLREAQNEKKFFTLVFATVFSVWFLWLPFMVSICQGVPSYDRWKVILGIKLSMQLIFYGLLFSLQLLARLTTWLSFTKKNRILNPADSDAEDTPYGTL